MTRGRGGGELRTCEMVGSAATLTGAAALAALLAACALLPQAVCAQGMAAAGKRDLPPIPLPEGVAPPRAEFEDVAAESGLKAPAADGPAREMTYLTETTGTGVALFDFDNDGWLDIFAVNGHVAPSVDGAGTGETFAQPRMLYWNRGDGIFHSLSDQAGPGISTGGHRGGRPPVTWTTTATSRSWS